jgi:hypothetical protein
MRATCYSKEVWVLTALLFAGLFCPIAYAAQRTSQGMAHRVDELLAQRWVEAKLEPAQTAGDAEFMRRAYLDLTGVIPRAGEVRQFLADSRPDKREQLVDHLLASPRYATHMATTWRNRIIPQDPDPSRAREAAALQKWLRTRFAKNLRYDNLVGGLLLTNGGDELGPALYFQTQDVAPEKIAASAAELFLGVKLQCAQCHDHPFADWSQQDFWSFAAFFARVKSPQNRGMPMMAYKLVDAESGEVHLPNSTEAVPPKYPRGDAVAADEGASRRAQLVFWLTSRDNRYFSRAAVNWAWSHLFGRGLVASLDNIDGASPPANAKLLDELADYFVDSGFDLQALWRALATTKAYQLSSRAADDPKSDPEVFASMLPKPLTPEQLYDSFVLLAPDANAGDEAMTLAPPQSADGLQEDPNRAAFVRRMRPPPGEATEFRAGTLQALMLMNGKTASGVTSPERSSVLGALEAPFMSDAERVESLFLATLSRSPDDDEGSLFLESLAECQSPSDRQRALSDMFWALLNSTEFAFNH